MIAGYLGKTLAMALRGLTRLKQSSANAKLHAFLFEDLGLSAFIRVIRGRFAFLPRAIIDGSDIIDRMASITIRQLPEATKRKLRIRAAQHGRSMEQEARDILKNELAKPMLAKPPQTGKDLVEAIRRRFAPYGGVELAIPARGPIRDPGIR